MRPDESWGCIEYHFMINILLFLKINLQNWRIAVSVDFLPDLSETDWYMIDSSNEGILAEIYHWQSGRISKHKFELLIRTDGIKFAIPMSGFIVIIFEGQQTLYNAVIVFRILDLYRVDDVCRHLLGWFQDIDYRPVYCMVCKRLCVGFR